MRSLLLLLLLQPDAPESLPASHPLAVIELASLSADLELYSPDTTWTGSFPTEFACVRQAMLECSDCPPLSDADRLPPREFTLAVLEINCRFRDAMDLRSWTYFHRRDEMTAILDQANRLRIPWSLADEATFPRGTWLSKRKALRELKRTIGGEAYYRADLGPWVPLIREVP